MILQYLEAWRSVGGKKLMKVEITELKPTSENIMAMAEIGRRCFGDDFSKDHLRENWLLCDDRTVFYGVICDGNLAAFNGFLAHPARSPLGKILLFQSCHSATSPDYRGRGFFQALIAHAKKRLPGDYIVGFPNNQSGPIFMNC